MNIFLTLMSALKKNYITAQSDNVEDVKLTLESPACGKEVLICTPTRPLFPGVTFLGSGL